MNWRCTELIFPQQQNAKGSLHNIDFGVFWVSWGGSAKEPDPGFDGFRQVLRFQGSGSEGCVKEVSKVSVFDVFRGVRFCSRVLTEPCLGTGF